VASAAGSVGSTLESVAGACRVSQQSREELLVAPVAVDGAEAHDHEVLLGEDVETLVADAGGEGEVGQAAGVEGRRAGLRLVAPPPESLLGSRLADFED